MAETVNRTGAASPSSVTMNNDQQVLTPLRAYQRRLCGEIQNTNALVVLPTGAGKTLVAAELLMRVRARRTAAGHAAAHRSGRTLFLVPTVMLVDQQAKTIKHETKLEVHSYHGQMKTLTCRSDVLVATPVAYTELLTNAPGLFEPESFDLVIFDEVRFLPLGATWWPADCPARIINWRPLAIAVTLG